MDKHLLIDGYNIIHAWPEFKKNLKLSWNVATNQLLKLVSPIHDTDNIRVTVVLDGKGPEIKIERPGKDLTLSVLYTPSHLSADTIIENLLINAQKPSTITVATHDVSICHIAQSLGSFVITLKELQKWSKRCQERQSFLLAQHKARQKNSFNPWAKLDL